MKMGKSFNVVKDKEFNLSNKRIVYSNASGRGLVRYDEREVKEFIKRLKTEGTIILADDIIVIRYSKFKELAGGKLI